MLSNHAKGVALAILGSVLWGASGNAGQFLLQDHAVPAEWLSSVRMIFAGLLLLAFDAFSSHGNVLSIWKDKRDAAELLAFAVIGMIGVQYTYFVAIALSNAPTATILQYMMPILIILWTAFRAHRLPTGKELLCLVLAVGGTVLLVTHGEWGRLAISPAALFWGLTSAAAAAFYIVQPKRLIRKWQSSALIVGWGMLVGGLILAPFSLGWEGAASLGTGALLALAFLVVFGTACAFGIYLASTKYIEPSEAGVLNSAEPLSSILFSVILLDLVFGIPECIGSALIILAVLVVSREEK